MTKFLIKAVFIYQMIFSSLLKQILGVSKMCRYSKTCSQYAMESIRKYGVFRGGYLSFARILKCQPLYGKFN